MMNAIVVDHLEVERGGRRVIPDLTWRVPVGQIVGLLGPSGCGKSTLMRAIVGVQIVKAGHVTVLERPAGAKDLRHRVGYVTQSASVYADLTVEENLRYFAAVLGTSTSNSTGTKRQKTKNKTEVHRVLELVDLERYSSARVDQLSGGQRSRVSLAAALIGTPELLVLDEPTVGLDPVLRRDLWRLFRKLADDGVTILVSSHVMDEAVRCDRLMLMRDGGVLADGPLAEILKSTGTDDVEDAFLTLVENR